jgi:hypothetical protein
MSKLITCPSGLTGEIRGLTGRAFEVLGDRKLQRDGMLGDRILRECWLATSDPGPYEFKDGKVDWAKVLTGDRTYALVQIRICMYGPQYTFRVPCQQCRETIEWPLDLNDLPVRLLAKEDLEGFRAGNRLTAELPDGRKFAFRLPTGEDEHKVAKFGNGGGAILQALAARVYEVEGADPARTLRQFFEGEEMSVIFDFLRAMDEHDCGVETEVEVACSRPNCGVVQNVNVPFGQAFLFPNTKRMTTGLG